MIRAVPLGGYACGKIPPRGDYGFSGFMRGSEDAPNTFMKNGSVTSPDLRQDTSLFGLLALLAFAMRKAQDPLADMRVAMIDNTPAR